jgi:hypothetical protein
LWRNNKCKITKTIKIIGNKKCNMKNRFRVGADTVKFPQSHITMILPNLGTADNNLVITVAPQRDICPHGST